VDELVDEGNPFEADVVPGVEHADKQDNKKRSGYGLRYCTTMAPGRMSGRTEVSVASHGRDGISTLRT
jgi:hypothetical protein